MPGFRTMPGIPFSSAGHRAFQVVRFLGAGELDRLPCFFICSFPVFLSIFLPEWYTHREPCCRGLPKKQEGFCHVCLHLAGCPGGPFQHNLSALRKIRSGRNESAGIADRHLSDRGRNVYVTVIRLKKLCRISGKSRKGTNNGSE